MAHRILFFSLILSFLLTGFSCAHRFPNLSVDPNNPREAIRDNIPLESGKTEKSLNHMRPQRNVASMLPELNSMGELNLPQETKSSLPIPSGYVLDVKKERQQKFKEIFLFFDRPQPTKKMIDSIFNPQLSREFQKKYQEKFGQLDTESLIYQGRTMKYLVFAEDDPRIVQLLKERRVFAEFMIKRLTEWHVDNYVKSDPKMRPVYEMKEKLSHVNVQVTQRSKLDIQYNLSGNYIDLILTNPYLDSKLSIVMDPRAFGPASVEENKIILAKQITPKHKLKNQWFARDGTSSLEIITGHRPGLTTSAGFTAKVFDSGRVSGETKYLLGVSYLF